MAQIGVVFPQTEFGNDPAVLRRYAQGLEQLGYRHLLAYDHVLGADTANRPEWRGAYRLEDPFHEVFTLFGFVAGVTTTLEMVTGVLILPQRQTALVAKQAASLDVLSGGRFRLGVGVGWNAVEYEALGEDFGNRGARTGEQVEVLRALWRNESVTFQGKWHTITEAGINPRPVRGDIPLWFGGYVDATFRRVAESGDGWFPRSTAAGGPDEESQANLARIRHFAEAIGRDPAMIGIEARVSVVGKEDDWRRAIDAWREFGATHISLVTMGSGLEGGEAHLARCERAAKVLELA